jgi:hypothetical protein
LHVELLEDRNLLSNGLMLTNPSLVSTSNPLPPPSPSSPTVFPNSEVEPQLAVDPLDANHVVAVWQQDRFRSVGGARAIVASVTHDASLMAGAHWTTPAAIPAFNSTDPAGAAFPRYTDPWVSFSPTGVLYATALALTPSGPFPGHTATLVVKSTTGGSSWSAATTLIDVQAPPNTDPIDLANDKESVTADPTNANDAYVVWDQLDHPSDQQNTNAFHGLAFRENALFARTIDGGRNWQPFQNLTNFQANRSAFGNIIVVEPNGDLVDVFTLGNGSGNQAAQAGQSTLGVLRSTDKGATWSDVISGPAIESMAAVDPETGVPVRDGDPLVSVAVDRGNGNLYAVWADGRFSDQDHDDIAFSMSTDGGLNWSDPIKVNQTPLSSVPGNEQAFTPNVAVAANHTVAVTYYDFRNNTPAPGMLTDYWLVHASGSFTNPASWTMDEKRLTDVSFNVENAARTSRGYFLGDYQGLAAAGNSFYSLFAQAGSSAADPSDIWFRDPPPAPGGGSGTAGTSAVKVIADPASGLGAAMTAGTDGVAAIDAGGRSVVADSPPVLENGLDALPPAAAKLADNPQSGDGNDLVPDGWDGLLRDGV